MALVETQLEGGVITVTLADEENRNALSSALVGELITALDAADADPAVRVVVLTNSGRVFCAGADLGGGGSAGDFPGTFWEKPTVNSFESGLEVFKPTIAAVNGHCIGYGLTAVVACDFVLASERATFAWPEVTLGIPTIVGAIRLPRRVAWADAMELLLTGETIDAGRAAAMGLVWRISEHDRLMDDARSLADRLCNAAPLAARATKEVAVRTRTMPWTEAVRFGETMRMVAAATDDATEGLQARADRRPPEWQGR